MSLFYFVSFDLCLLEKQSTYISSVSKGLVLHLGDFPETYILASVSSVKEPSEGIALTMNIVVELTPCPPQVFDSNNIIREIKDNHKKTHCRRFASLSHVQACHSHRSCVNVAWVQAHDVEWLSLSKPHKHRLGMPEIIDIRCPIRN